MTAISMRRRIWGWFFFDWASQPYNTLLITFIFAPYVKELMGDGTAAQSAWGFGIGAAGFVIAVLAPFLGALADTSGNRLRYIWLFSVMYVIGAFGLWWAAPDDFNLILTLVFFAIGMIGMEFATIFTNSMLPDLGPRDQIGRISGNGWAFGYLGGMVTLIIMLALLAESATTGKTFIGIDPILGLDPAQREGTRAVGPLTAIWYIIFMIPFFLWVREPKRPPGTVRRAGASIAELWRSIKGLLHRRSLAAYLGSSMFYRDALNGLYGFGGVYAVGVLDWTVVQVGTFGILGGVTATVACWFGGKADRAFGPKPVITTSILLLIAICLIVVGMNRQALFGVPLAEGSRLPDIVFYVCGGLIGAAGGTLQAASRTLMTRHTTPERAAEAFGLYALSGRATSFVAPALIAAVSAATGNQQIGITPLIALFLVGLVLLVWVKPDGDRAEWSAQPSPASR